MYHCIQIRYQNINLKFSKFIFIGKPKNPVDNTLYWNKLENSLNKRLEYPILSDFDFRGSKCYFMPKIAHKIH